MSNDYRDQGLFSLLDGAERERIHWRIADAFEELYESLNASYDDAQLLEDVLSVH